MIIRLFLSVFILFSMQLEAAPVRVNFEIPYSSKEKRVQGNSGIKTVVEIPYKSESGFCLGSCDQPSKDDLKNATDKVASGANLTLWRAYLAKMPSSNISQKETEARKRIDDLVYDVSIEHQVVTADKMIVFTLRGKINNNLVDQIAGFEPSEADLSKARRMAKKEVLDKYISQLDSSKTSQVEKRKINLYERMDDLITELSVRDHRVISDRKVVEYAIKASVNDSLFSELLFPSSEQSKTGEGIGLAYLILPRIKDMTKTFDATVKIKTARAGGVSSEKQSSEGMDEVGDGGIEEYENASLKARSAKSKTTSGSSIQKRDEVTWGLGNVQTVTAQVNRFLTDAGYEAESFASILGDCNDESDPLSPETLRDEIVSSKTGEYDSRHAKIIKQALWDCEADFFAKGVLDIHSIKKDRNSGGISAEIKVQIMVTRIVEKGRRKKRLKETVVGSVAFDRAGIGASEESAINDAIEKGSKAAVDIILTQIKKKGIR
ncbi:MAG: hypothetical protein HOF36_07890 [Candidatus Marinimicrobia bacterium]|nr:hypothetical protein [Candidatus Neomarinimicrobiota bacterium]MBT6217891.1 hypothetical protein [Candidatus Neomarinimicrobiota bacterium]MBT7829891.1 hypothetical protein [Candidatus Neomarinimicrobiota bacterium]